MKRNLGILIVAALSVGAFFLGWSISAKDGEVTRRYYTMIQDVPGQVYDGDTIQDAIVGLPVEAKPVEGEEYPIQIWPGVYQNGKDVYMQIDIRLFGIQAPEKRVSTSLPEEERQRLKALAAESEQALERLLNQSLFPGFIILDRPQYGKYVGRIVAEVKIPVLVKDDRIVELDELGEGVVYKEIDVAEYMIENGYAEVADF